MPQIETIMWAGVVLKAGWLNARGFEMIAQNKQP